MAGMEIADGPDGNQMGWDKIEGGGTDVGGFGFLSVFPGKK